MPSNTRPCSGITAYQYASPISPRGLKRAVWVSVQLSVSCSSGTNLKAEERFARQLHFGTQFESPIGFDSGHAPEIQRLSVRKPLRVAPAAAEARSANELVNPAAYLPQPVGRVVALIASDPRYGAVH